MKTDKDLKQTKLYLRKGRYFDQYIIRENDDIDFDFKNDKGKTISVHGYVIKIGIDDINKKEYMTVLSYNYGLDDTVFFVYIDQITKIGNITHPNKTASFSPVYCADESVILLRSSKDTDEMEYSRDGKIWNPVGTGSGSGESSRDGQLMKIMRQKGFDGTISDLADLLLELYKNKDDIVARKIETL